MKHLITVIPLCILCGCASFSTNQKDVSYDEKTGTKIREITTTATATTIWESKQLTQWKASQTDKTQGASVGSSQESIAATNTANLIESIARGAVQGAINANGGNALQIK